ncbi:MAG: tetratricopeptide repeat protein [Candidatus Schekmanbacteria bacterium]|nr:tetratricopeptide repeat protein [Candidatus Schekmanbacteria bacterium]
MSLKKKLTRKEMLNQPDEFVAGFTKTAEFIRHNKSLIQWGIAGLLLLIIATIAHFVYHGNKKEQAGLLEAEALKAYQGEQTDRQNMPETVGKTSDYKAAQIKFRELLDKYPGTENARRALLYLADCSYKLKEYAQAEKLYHQYLAEYPEQDMWQMLALHSLAYSQEEEGKYLNAADNYQKLASLLGDDKQKQIVYLDLARTYKLGKAWDKAIQVYQNMLQTLEDPAQAEIIKNQMAQAKAQMTDKGAVQTGN